MPPKIDEVEFTFKPDAASMYKRIVLHAKVEGYGSGFGVVVDPDKFWSGWRTIFMAILMTNATGERPTCVK